MDPFSIKNKVAVITGGGGVLGGSIASHFAKQGAKIALLDIREENLSQNLSNLRQYTEAEGYACNVLDKVNLEKTAKGILSKWGSIDILLNIAGGNLPGATLSEDQDIFDMKMEDFEKVNQLNLNGTVLPCLVFGKIMAQQGSGSIVNVSSMATFSAITRVPGYSTAKSGVNIFTKWLSMEMAQKFGDHIRVNAIAPGFFIGDQNRAVLINPDGSYTERSKKILARTPMGRFGNIDELNGLVQFLSSDAASFITGTVIPVDGGFSAYSGV